jgi:hypothetical protein
MNLFYTCDLRAKVKLSNLICNIFTMKSARDDSLLNPLDYTGELIAQYLLTGHIKFNQLPLSIVGSTRSTLYKNNEIFTINDNDRNELNIKWKEAEIIFENILDNMFKSLVGNVLKL